VVELVLFVLIMAERWNCFFALAQRITYRSSELINPDKRQQHTPTACAAVSDKTLEPGL
jgi:hypothetical protein